MLNLRFVVLWIMANFFMKKVNRLRTEKKTKIIHIKEIKFRPGTDESDYQVKLRNLIRF